MSRETQKRGARAKRAELSSDELSPKDLSALVDSAKHLSLEIDLADLLEEILDRAGLMTDSPSGSVMLIDEERAGLYFAAATGPKARGALEKFGEFAHDRIPIWKNREGREYGSVAGEVFDSGKSVVRDSLKKDAAHFKGVDRNTNYSTESMVCVPLVVGKRCIGVMQLLNKSTGNYSRRDVLLLENFAAHAAIAIRNARHFRDLLAHKGLFSSSQAGKKTTDLLKLLSAPAKQQKMTVLFADMRGFTRFGQVLGNPVEIERHLNEFLTLLASQVLENEGLVNKFLGDGVLALFDDGKHTNAVRCAFGILDKFTDLRHRWDSERAESLAFLDVGIGIATGDVILGAIGTGRVKDFTALGNPVNLAAALESQARGGMQVLVDQPTFSAVNKIVAEFESLGTYQLKKPDQAYGIEVKRYHLKKLRGEAPATIAAKPAPADPASLKTYYDESWAVVVGVDRYQSPAIPQLSYAKADADAVASALPKLGFPRNHIDVLHDEQATTKNIRQSLFGRINDMGPEDRLFVFFALHGHLLKQHRGGEEGYLLPYDADPDNLPTTALPMFELARSGRVIPAKHILFVLDACHSGFATRREINFRGGPTDLSILTRENVVAMLTAGSSGQSAFEEGGHGLFTKILLKGLDGWADPEGTGLTALKLAGFIQERVIQESGNQQTPLFQKMDGEGEFVFLPPKT